MAKKFLDYNGLSTLVKQINGITPSVHSLYVKDGLLYLSDAVEFPEVLNLFKYEKRRTFKRWTNKSGFRKKGWLCSLSLLVSIDRSTRRVRFTNEVTGIVDSSVITDILTIGTDKKGRMYVAWGSRQIKLVDANGNPRIVRLRCALGQGISIETPHDYYSCYCIYPKGNIMEFYLEYNPKKGGWVYAI